MAARETPSAAPPESAADHARAHEGTPPEGALALPSAGDVERFVQCHRNTFVVTARGGDIAPAGARELGLFHDDTRHLSLFALDVQGATPIKLSGATRAGNTSQFDMMLSDLELGALLDDPQNFLHIRRAQVLDDGFAEEATFTNFLHRPVELVVRYRYAADFADIFEVRGASRPRRGAALPAALGGDRARLGYRGLDGLTYATELAFDPRPAVLTDGYAEFRVVLTPGEAQTITVEVTASRSDAPPAPRATTFARRVARAAREARDFVARATAFECDEAVLQGVLARAVDDLGALRVEVGGHAIVAAGIPWFCAPFGRDALIASMEALAVLPDLAAETLSTLAVFQATEDDPWRDAEPGKILHELRRGEMVRTRELPHSPYYGSIDATPLWIVGLHETWRWTADHALVRRLRPALERALGWLDAQTDEGRRLLAYQKRNPKGLDNQGWKDSREGVSFPGGALAEPPIALVEVQGYAFDAYRRGADLLASMGDAARAAALQTRAERLRERVEAEMWLGKRGHYALAIDGRGRALDTVASNAGHLLWSGLPSPRRAERTAALLLAPASFSGFGVRTLAEGQPVYNPLSYHNGTVWPHDNALVAEGMARYGLGDGARAICDALHAAMGAFRDRRLPELFCGMTRGAGDALVHYPVSCSPQAWAAAAPFLLLQAVLGLRPDAPAGRLTIHNPRLPAAVRQLTIRRMRVGGARVSLRVRRVGRACHVDRLDVEGGPLKVTIEMD